MRPHPVPGSSGKTPESGTLASTDSNRSGDLTPAHPQHSDGFVPVLRPKLPSATSILRYLERIDESRTYSNFGPLATEFQQRMSDILQVPPACFVTASCGTTALIGAILATAGAGTRSRPLALLPSYTFAATAIAVERCGYEPYLLDVDPDTWALCPETLSMHPQIGRAGVVVPVAPFGRPLSQTSWAAFQAKTGIPVVLDAAASFAIVSQHAEHTLAGPLPSVFSFHATKSFGLGEGGGVACTDEGLASRITSALNFGFIDSRDSAVPSMNGKMSEYHAAVGLAEIDGWTRTVDALRSVTDRYRSAFSDHALADRFFGFPDVDGCYALFLCESAAAGQRVRTTLQNSQIDTRLWYGTGLHNHTHFAAAPRDELSVTELLAPRLIGLPMAPDLPDRAIQRIALSVQKGLSAT